MSNDSEKPKFMEIEPGEVVLRAETPVEASPAAPSQPLNYHVPIPHNRGSQFNGITWPRVACAVLVLILLGVYALPPLFTRSDQNWGRRDESKTDLKLLELAIKQFEIDVGRCPSQREGLQALVRSPPGVVNWHGPYVRLLPADGWNRPYTYVIPGVHNSSGFDLSSDGPDRKHGTADDITNW